MSNVIILKSILTIFSIILSVVVNYFLLCDKKKLKKRQKVNKSEKYFRICVYLIVVINVVLLIADCFLIKNEIEGYVAFIMLLSFMLSITFEDIKTGYMDTRVILGYLILFLIYRIVFLDKTIFLEGLIGFLLSSLIMLVAYFIKKNSIGIGDVEAIATCGMIIGFPNIFYFLFKAFLFVFVAGIVLMITKKRKLFTELPLAPFLLLATII